MYGYFANKSKHRLIVKNIYKNMAIYLKNRKINKKIATVKKNTCNGCQKIEKNILNPTAARKFFFEIIT